MALTDIVYKRKKDDRVVALIIASPVLKEWQLDRVIQYDMVYYKLSAVERLSPDLKYPYRYTLTPIQHDDKDIDLVKSNALTYTPETIAEAADIAKSYRLQLTAGLFGLIVSLLPESWQKGYRNINPFYRPERATFITGLIQFVSGIGAFPFVMASKLAPIYYADPNSVPHPPMAIVLWLIAEGSVRLRIGYKLNRGCGSIVGMIIALPVEVVLWLIKKLRA